MLNRDGQIHSIDTSLTLQNEYVYLIGIPIIVGE